MHVIILGAPGSGKGTQSIEIMQHFSLKHLSTGDMLRAEIAAGSALGLAAKAVMDAGNLVNDDIIIDMVKNQVQSHASGVLFDGFPRTKAQAEALDAMLKELGSEIAHVIQLDVADEEIIKRMLARGREDDNEETIRNRLAVYNEQTAPLIDYYQKAGKLSRISGTGSVAEIFSRIQQILEK